MDEFDGMIEEANAADVSGWGFGWLEGRAAEQRPSWGYQKLMIARLASVDSALDIQTGGGEVLDGASRFPRTMAATESWAPNLALATRRLHPRGVVVVADPDEPPLPFGDDAFELVISRHPATIWWNEIARVLRPGGTYLAQHVGPESLRDLYEWFLGPQRLTGLHSRHPERETALARDAGLRVVSARMETLRVEFFDVGAVVYFLRKVIWTVPDFATDKYRDRLRALHEHILRNGSFVTHSTRVLFEAEAPARAADGR